MLLIISTGKREGLGMCLNILHGSQTDIMQHQVFSQLKSKTQALFFLLESSNS